MARVKKPSVYREPSDSFVAHNGVVLSDINGAVDDIKESQPKHSAHGHKSVLQQSQPGLKQLVIGVGGIYLSFLTWGFLQERIATTSYGPASAPEKWKFSIVLNTIQSTLAALSGFAYLLSATSHPHKPGRPAPIFPTSHILPPLLIVSVTSSLASPFGYAALNYVDYITYILAKSSKLLPVMAINKAVYRKKYPFYKYCVVMLVTLGVGIFTLHHPSTASKAGKHSSKRISSAKTYYGVSGDTLFGLSLLGVNLLFDGLFNSVQDSIFQKFRPYSGPQMMCAQNIISTALTTTYLVVAPYLAPTALGQMLSLPVRDELSEAIAFINRNPAAGKDVLLFGMCGAFGQVFIFYTLATFSSLLLVTVNVTRKMLTMVVSVFWYGHKITSMQWVGVGLVFGGIGGEAFMARREKLMKQEKEKARVMSEAGQKKDL